MPGDLCELSLDRISALVLPGFRLFQRLSGIAEMPRFLPCPPAQHRGRPAARHGRAGTGQFAPRGNRQAHVLDWQIRTVFIDGGAGVFVYAWTDEWFRGGSEVDGWEFGITDRNRDPKLALVA